jgi:AraC-like DNA-binding protein
MLSTLDIALRAAAIALLALIAVVLLRDFGRRSAAQLAAALAAGSAIHALSSAAGFSSAFGHANLGGASLIAIATGNIVVFWLFTRAVFDDAFQVRLSHALIWAAIVSVSLVNCLLAGASMEWPSHLVGAGLNILSLFFIALAIAQTIATWSGDLVEGRRQLRVFVVTAAAAYGVFTALLQLFGEAGPPSAAVSVANAAALFAVAGAVALSLTRLAGEDLFAEAATPSSTGDTTAASVQEASFADRKLSDALNRLMTEQRIYREEGLSIGVLATKLGVPEYRLRRLINGQLGYRNFNAFLNGYRIAEARAALADPAQAQVPVTTIALDAGFQSIGPFNRAFKVSTGVTPTEYRRERLAGAAS